MNDFEAVFSAMADKQAKAPKKDVPKPKPVRPRNGRHYAVAAWLDANPTTEVTSFEIAAHFGWRFRQAQTAAGAALLRGFTERTNLGRYPAKYRRTK
jgi:hypothetical protein